MCVPVRGQVIVEAVAPQEIRQFPCFRYVNYTFAASLAPHTSEPDQLGGRSQHRDAVDEPSGRAGWWGRDGQRGNHPRAATPSLSMTAARQQATAATAVRRRRSRPALRPLRLGIGRPNCGRAALGAQQAGDNVRERGLSRFGQPLRCGQHGLNLR